MYTDDLFQQNGSKICPNLASHDDILNTVFGYLAHSITSVTACQLLEDLLQSRRHVLNLNTISQYLKTQ